MSTPIPIRRGLALIEAVLSMLVLSVMLVAALNAVGASRVGQLWNSDHLRGLSLASDLMAEILDQSYDDPSLPPIFGPEANEVAPGRPAYDDVDDYNGYTESPPKDKGGTVMTGLANWSRSVTVVYVKASDLTTAVLTDNGIKKVSVTIKHNGRVVAELTALRTPATPH